MPADFSFDAVTDHLYVGSRFDPADWFVLAALNITVDINLQIEGHDHFLRNAPEIYLWIPTPDWYGPSVQTITTVASFIGLMVGEGRKVYLHCDAGVGRAPAAAVGYLITIGLNFEEALDYLKVKRPASRLSDAQLQQLREFAAIWKNSR
jgi:atypical dual specificity phosphatase